MSIVNLQRDGVFTILNGSRDKVFSQDSLYTDNNFDMNCDPTVYDDQSSVQSDRAPISVTAGNVKGIVVLLQPPDEDMCPYRIKAYCNSADVNSANEFLVGIGYGPASPTGTNDTIADPTYLPIGKMGRLDELVMIPGLTEADPMYGRAIAFAVLVVGAVSNDSVFAHLSVQRLATVPPTFAQSTA